MVETTVIAQWSHDQGVVSLNPIGCWASLFGSLLSTLSFKRYLTHGVATMLNGASLCSFGQNNLSYFSSPQLCEHFFKSPAVCGGELMMESGQLESPNYPEDYQPNKECIWKITVPVGFQVALKFQSFEVGEHFTSLIFSFRP